MAERKKVKSMPAVAHKHGAEKEKSAYKLFERIAERTRALGLTYEQLEQDAIEETRKYRSERKRHRSDRS